MTLSPQQVVCLGATVPLRAVSVETSTAYAGSSYQSERHHTLHLHNNGHRLLHPVGPGSNGRAAPITTCFGPGPKNAQQQHIANIYQPHSQRHVCMGPRAAKLSAAIGAPVTAMPLATTTYSVTCSLGTCLLTMSKKRGPVLLQYGPPFQNAVKWFLRTTSPRLLIILAGFALQWWCAARRLAWPRPSRLAYPAILGSGPPARRKRGGCRKRQSSSAVLVGLRR